MSSLVYLFPAFPHHQHDQLSIVVGKFETKKRHLRPDTRGLRFKNSSQSSLQCIVNPCSLHHHFLYQHVSIFSAKLNITTKPLVCSFYLINQRTKHVTLVDNDYWCQCYRWSLLWQSLLVELCVVSHFYFSSYFFLCQNGSNYIKLSPLCDLELSLIFSAANLAGEATATFSARNIVEIPNALCDDSSCRTKVHWLQK